MVSRLTDWWFNLKDSLSLKMMTWRYCTIVGHITTPPYNFKSIDQGWPRCRRCEITMIPDEDLPLDFWDNRDKYH